MLAVFGLSIACHASGSHPACAAAGIILTVLGGAVGLAGGVALRRALTPFPKPLPDAQLVRSGIYSRIRHPLYTSVTLMSVGWAIAWDSMPGLLAALVLAPFFAAKARREEAFLRERFPDYVEYSQSTKRFIPWIV